MGDEVCDRLGEGVSEIVLVGESDKVFPIAIEILGVDVIDIVGVTGGVREGVTEGGTDTDLVGVLVGVVDESGVLDASGDLDAPLDLDGDAVTEIVLLID